MENRQVRMLTMTMFKNIEGARRPRCWRSVVIVTGSEGLKGRGIAKGRNRRNVDPPRLLAKQSSNIELVVVDQVRHHYPRLLVRRRAAHLIPTQSSGGVTVEGVFDG